VSITFLCHHVIKSSSYKLLETVWFLAHHVCVWHGVYVCNVRRVPAWRRRLVCSVCQLSGCGACICCEMPSCTNAFHAMCAQTVGIYMRLEPACIGANGSRSPACIGANGSRSVPAHRTVYCNLHRPVETSAVTSGSHFTYKLNGCLKSSKKVKKLGAEGSAMSAVATSLHIPTNK